MENVTTKSSAADKLSEYGRYGDSEMAHVTPGELVVPHSIQTPEVMNSLQSEFHRQGVPMDRYVVGNTNNSQNPQSGKDEYFWAALAAAAAPHVIDAVTGGGGGDETQAATTGAQPAKNPLPAPVQAAQAQPQSKDYLQGVQFTPLSNGEQPATPAVDSYAQNSYMQTQDPTTAALMGVMPVSGAYNNVNPHTGRPEYYDLSGYRDQGSMMRGGGSSVNPSTGMQEYYDQKDFDADAYLSANKDVADSGIDAWQHYNQYGKDEGRKFTSAMSGAGISRVDNQDAKRKAGYTGDFDGGYKFHDWARSNPDGYFNYLREGSKVDGFKNPVDMDLNREGQQGFSRDLNNYLGNTVGWKGEVGQGQMGSGLKGIDYLSLNPQKQQEYTSKRQLADPTYQWSEKSSVPDDFNEKQYLQNNPAASARVSAGDKYTSGAHHYYLDGQNKGLDYSTPEPPSWYNDLMSRMNQPQAPQTPQDVGSNNANIQNVSTLSPVRSPRFRSNRYAGSYAPSF